VSRAVHARAPCRLSLAGGGTDVSPYTEAHGGAVTNLAIDVYMEASLEPRNDATFEFHSVSTGLRHRYDALSTAGDHGVHRLAVALAARLWHGERGFTLRYASPVPERSGLGGSSALGAAMAGCFNHVAGDRRVDAYELAELLYTVERVDLKNLGGRQDQYAAIFGGINFIEFRGDNFVRVNPLRPSRSVVESLQRCLLLFWIGEREASGGIIEEQVRNVAAKGDALEAMHETKRMAVDVKHALLIGELQGLAGMLHQAWMRKKRFGAAISNSRIDALYESMRDAGMIGGKITGAGGGGHMIAFVPFRKRQDVIAVVEAAGGRHVRYRIDTAGLTTWQDDG
jgi:D-glycero-alpha-D-manno-heptose-7-phosphate kinase